jgi:hypothetical protein
MTTCVTCKTTLGLTRVHGGDSACPVRASFWCSQCGCYGHRPAECDNVTHVTRPRTLEDLIPSDLRERWAITTDTPIVWNWPSLEEAEKEIAESNTITIVYREGKMDSKIRETMRHYKIPTVHKMDGNIQKLRTWAVSQGKKIRLLQEK